MMDRATLCWLEIILANLAARDAAYCPKRLKLTRGAHGTSAQTYRRKEVRACEDMQTKLREIACGREHSERQ